MEEYYLDQEARKSQIDGVDRAVKGYCMETYLPDGTIVETYDDTL